MMSGVLLSKHSKTHLIMKRPTSILIPLFLSCLISFSSVAQETPAPPESLSKRIDAEFDDLRLEEVVRYFRGEFQDINFVITPEASSIPISLELSNVSLKQIAHAISLSTRGSITIQFEADDLVFIDVAGHLASTPQRPILRVFSVSKLLQQKEENEQLKQLEDIDHVIQTTLQMWNQTLNDNRQTGMPTAKVGKPKINFHSRTRSFIVIADPVTMDIVTEVFSSLIQPQHIPARPSGFSGGMGSGGYGGTGFGFGDMMEGGGDDYGGGRRALPRMQQTFPSQPRQQKGTRRNSPSLDPFGGGGAGAGQPKKPNLPALPPNDSPF